MLFKPASFFALLLLISNFILVTFADYTLGIKRDASLGTTYVWSSVAVYDSQVDTTTFSQSELYGLAQKAWNEMQAGFNGQIDGRTYGKRLQPFSMSAMATKNLVYFASSTKGPNYIQNVASKVLSQSSFKYARLGCKQWRNLVKRSTLFTRTRPVVAKSDVCSYGPVTPTEIRTPMQVKELL